MERAQWNQFVLKHGPRSGRFLQSWEWGEFQKAVGERVRRQVFGDREGSEVYGVAQWLERRLPLVGTYAYCPKGPVGMWHPTDETELFLRIEGQEQVIPESAITSIELNPAHTLITSLDQDEDRLLSGMHSKTRYNIRYAHKKGVEVQLRAGHFDEVWLLFEQTAERGGFRLHRKSYYAQMISSLEAGECQAFLASATHEGDLLAANVMIDFGDTRTYLHGASSNLKRNLMAPYLLHWELLKEAKEQGTRFYDWWGVAPVGADSTHAWSGISRFKRGFGGEEIGSPGTYDVVLNRFRYRLYQWARRVRRM